MMHTIGPPKDPRDSPSVPREGGGSSTGRGRGSRAGGAAGYEPRHVELQIMSSVELHPSNKHPQLDRHPQLNKCAVREAVDADQARPDELQVMSPAELNPRQSTHSTQQTYETNSKGS